MSGFGDFLVGAVQGGTAGVEQRVQDDLKQQRLMSIEEYRLERKAHWDAITRAQAFKEETDPVRRGILKSLADEDAEDAAARTGLPEARKSVARKREDAALLAGEEAGAREEAEIKAQIRTASAVQDKELALTWGRLVAGAENMDALGIERTNDNITALFNGVHKTKLPTSENTAVATAANKRYLAPQIERAVSSAGGLYGAAITRAAEDVIGFIPDKLRATKDATNTIKADLLSELNLYSVAVTSEDKTTNAARHYDNVMKGLTKAAKLMGPDEEGRAAIVGFSTNVRRAHEELIELQRELNVNPAIQYVGVQDAYDRFSLYNSGDKSNGFVIFNMPGIRAARTANMGDAERNGILSLDESYGAEGAPPPPKQAVAEPAEAVEATTTTTTPPASTTPGLVAPTEEKPTVLVQMEAELTGYYTPMLLTALQQDKEKEAGKAEDILKVAKEHLKGVIVESTKAQGGIVPDDDAQRMVDAIWERIMNELKANANGY